eukprot:726905-Prorocentrum_minimum.AAC.2
MDSATVLKWLNASVRLPSAFLSASIAAAPTSATSFCKPSVVGFWCDGTTCWLSSQPGHPRSKGRGEPQALVSLTWSRQPQKGHRRHRIEATAFEVTHARTWDPVLCLVCLCKQIIRTLHLEIMATTLRSS